jgi:hypothetical protein
VEVAGQAFEHRSQHSCLAPVLKPPMHRLVSVVTIGQILRWCSGAQNPQDAIERRALIDFISHRQGPFRSPVIRKSPDSSAFGLLVVNTEKFVKVQIQKDALDLFLNHDRGTHLFD